MILGGGIPLRGQVNLPTEALPVLISIAPRAQQPPLYGVTDEEGNFNIPGLLPGQYHLTTRGSMGQSAEEVLEKDFSVVKEQIFLNLGVIAPEPLAFALEIDRGGGG